MNLEHVFSVLLIRRIGWWVIHFTWQGTVIAVVTSLILVLLKKADARIRYTVGCAALVSIVLFPLMTVFLKNPLPFPSAGTAQIAQNNPVDVQEFRTDNTVTSRQYRSQAISIPFWTTEISFCENHLSQITAVWIVGVFLFSFYRLFGFFQLYFIIRAIKEPVEALWEKRIRTWIKRLNIRQHIRILQSDRIDTPGVYGWIKPVLLIPVSFLIGMDAQTVESIIIHELAHIRRYDYLVNMIQVMIEALGFFHPAVWWLSNRIRKEREDCCDDWSVRVLGDRLIYVKSLVRLEETRRCPRPVMAANGSELSRRVMRILDYQYARHPSSVIYTFVFSLSLASILLFTGFRFSEGQTIVQTENLKSHLVAYYPFTGDAKDMSGLGNHGGVKGAVLTADRFGRKDQAYSFNGKNALIWVDGTGRLFFNGSVTVSCWINPQKMVPYASWVSMSYAQAYRSQWRSGFGPEKNSEWGFTETVADEDSKVWADYLVTQSEIPLNEWTHVTTVANQETGEIIMYKNGQRIGRIDQLKPYIEEKNFLYIGFQADNPAFFAGSIDEVRIYDTALDDDEVYTVYKMN
jgi:beta-lactamase regulating signal transducer with metallopeptidase domain